MDLELVSKGLSSLSLEADPGVNNNNNNNNNSAFLTFICDLQYGFPNERRPRREKIGAIAKQLANFINWQQQLEQQSKVDTMMKRKQPASVLLLVHLEQDDDAVTEIMGRILDHTTRTSVEDHTTVHIVKATTAETTICQHESSSEKNQPQRIQRTSQPLKQVVSAMKGRVIYLSPDAETILSSSLLSSSNNPNRQDDLTGIIIGGIIDRKHIQENRSLSRATELDIFAARWPVPADWDMHEPFNVDCILQGMQQWIWTGNLQASIAARSTTSGPTQAQAMILKYPPRYQTVLVGAPDENHTSFTIYADGIICHFAALFRDFASGQGLVDMLEALMF